MPHIHEKIDFVADAYIVYNNRVLLRMHDKYKNWLPPGGHIEPDEDPTQAAIREAKEEVGLDIELVDTDPPTPHFPDYFSTSTELMLPRSINRHRINETHEHISFGYFATTKTDEIKQGEREISPSIHWFTDAELDDPKFGISERIRHYAHAALKELGTPSSS
jgi:8-oxo-dGTP pyrophosphatase MutT (NUDIX family)